MRVGVPREVKNNEFRVALTPAGAHEFDPLRARGVRRAAAPGIGSSITNADFEAVGAQSSCPGRRQAVWAAADLLLKVKEPIEQEYHRLRRGQVLFTYLHLAASLPCTRALLDSGTTAIAYETVRFARRLASVVGSDERGRGPAGAAGRERPRCWLRPRAGAGCCWAAYPGSAPANVVVIGAGVSGQNAVAMAVGLGADVTVLDLDIAKLRHLDDRYAGRVRTVVSNTHELEQACLQADLVIGAVLVPGARAPRLVSNELVQHG